MTCLICLDEKGFTKVDELVHIVECKNCEEKNIMVHRKCMDDWKKTSFKERDGKATCPHCSCEMYLYIQPMTIIFTFIIYLRHFNFCKFVFLFSREYEGKESIKTRIIIIIFTLIYIITMISMGIIVILMLFFF